MVEVTLPISRKADLGEGAIWNPVTEELWWVDIEQGVFYAYHPQSLVERAYEIGQRIGTVVPTANGTAVVALQDGVYEFDLATKRKNLIASPEDPALGNRFNDGKCDPMGRLWAGTYNMEDLPGRAALYRIDSSGAVERMLTGVTCSNGICWSRDNTTMYYIDTPTGVVQAFDFDLDSGGISNKRVVIRIPEEMGLPDGMTMDEHGMLWIALWKGGAVTRWNPDSGKLLGKIPLPVIHVTSCAFGGTDLDTLYVTTASVDMTPEEKAYYRLAGCVFACKTGIKGLPPFIFGAEVQENAG